MNQRVEVPFGRIGVITSDLNKQLTNGETINSEIVLLKFAEILINTENMPAFVDFISGLPSDELKIKCFEKYIDKMKVSYADEISCMTMVITSLSNYKLKFEYLKKYFHDLNDLEKFTIIGRTPNDVLNYYLGSILPPDKIDELKVKCLEKFDNGYYIMDIIDTLSNEQSRMDAYNNMNDKGKFITCNFDVFMSHLEKISIDVRFKNFSEYSFQNRDAVFNSVRSDESRIECLEKYPSVLMASFYPSNPISCMAMMIRQLTSNKLKLEYLKKYSRFLTNHFFRDNQEIILREILSKSNDFIRETIEFIAGNCSDQFILECLEKYIDKLNIHEEYILIASLRNSELKDDLKVKYLEKYPNMYMLEKRRVIGSISNDKLRDKLILEWLEKNLSDISGERLSSFISSDLLCLSNDKLRLEYLKKYLDKISKFDELLLLRKVSDTELRDKLILEWLEKNLSDLNKSQMLNIASILENGKLKQKIMRELEKSEKIKQELSEDMKMILRNYQIKHINSVQNENDLTELKKEYGIVDIELELGKPMSQEEIDYETNRQQFIENVANYHDDYQTQLMMIGGMGNDLNPYGVTIDEVLKYQTEHGIGIKQESKSKKKKIINLNI